MNQSELVTNTFRLADAPAQLAAVADGAAWPHPDARKLGAWQVTTGPLNRVLLLCEKPAEPERTMPWRAPPAASPTSRHVELLREMRPFEAQGTWAGLYELRIYSLYPAHADAFEQLMRDILPVRTLYSPNVGAWRAASGDVDRVFHLWAYADMAARNAVRPAIDADERWRSYVAAITPMITRMESMLLAPILFDSAHTAT